MDAPLAVFVSSVIGEFLPYRTALKESLADSPLARFWVFEWETAASELVPRYLLRAANADIFVLLIGDLITEPVIEEFRTALKADRPILAFVKRSAATRAQELFAAHDASLRLKYALFDGPDLVDLVIEAVSDEIILRFRSGSHPGRDPANQLPRLPVGDRRKIESAYREEVLKQFEYWSERYTPLHASAAARVELPPQIASTPARFRQRGFRAAFDRRTGKRVRFEDLRDAVEELGDLIVLGEPGAGKTTTLWRLMYDQALKGATSADAPLPVLISLGRYQSGADILGFVRTELELASREETGKVAYPAHRRVAARLEDFLAEGRLLFLFDAINEMPLNAYTESIRRIQTFRDQHRNHRFVFTCRALDYTVKMGISEVTVEELDGAAQRGFLTAHFGSKGENLYSLILNDHRDLLIMGRNPYMLWMLGAVYVDQEALPANRGLLFKEFVSALVDRERQTQPARWIGEETECRLLAGIAELALAVHTEWGGGTSFPRDWAERSLGRGSEEIIYLARSASILERAADSSLRFSHQLLQEYFAAAALNAQGAPVSLLREVARYPRWDEVLVLLAGLMDDATAVVDILIPLDPRLSARCLAGARKVSPAVSEKLVSRLMEWIASSLPGSNVAAEALRTIASEDTLPLLLRWAAKENQSAARQAAVYAMGKVPGIATRLAEYLSDSDPGVIRAALQGLAEWKEDLSAAHVVACIRQESLRESAVQALWSFRPEIVTPLLLALLGPEQKLDVRKAALRVLQEYNTPEAGHTVIGLLDDSSPEMRSFAARAAGKLHATEAVPRLIRLLKRKATQIEAAHALGRLGAREAIPHLVKMLDVKDRDACAAAGDALAKMPATEVIGRLAPRLASEDVAARFNAAQTIRLLGSPEGVPYLLPLLEDRDLWVRREAVTGLTAIDSQLEHLIRLLDDEDPVVRLAVARAVAKVNPGAAASSLIVLMKKSDPNGLEWRYKAVEALASIPVDVLVAQLVPLLDDPDDFVRLMSAETLGFAGATGAIPALRRVLERDGDPVGQRGAAFGLGAMGVRAAAPYLISLLNDSQPGPRQAAAESLGALGSEYVHCLFPLLHDPSFGVRQAVEEIWKTKAAEEDLDLLQPLLMDKDRVRQRDAYQLITTIGRRLNLPKDDPRMRGPV